ncbi:uncharacterized protein [Enoplosus armatus]|uniref:uncharacterized protein isoform X2 n=1 Tax=Enoplosus armatus TaxID=215367 RepID=UPI00399294D1
MSGLLSDIRSIHRDAARVLEKADMRTDSDIQSLTREDLRELFPGAEKLKLRRTIFEIIHKQPVDVLLRELKAFIPHESLRASLTNNGVLVDYLRILKDMKAQMNYVQSFLDAHIGLLEELSKNQPAQRSDKGSLSSTSNSAPCHPMEPHSDQTVGHPQGTGTWDICGQVKPSTGSPGGGPQGAQGGFFPLSQQYFQEVKYQMVVSGKTFDAHLQLMEKVKGIAQDQIQLHLIESTEDYQITIVFCPISSRIESDVEGAMADVKVSAGNTPVILVLMHHVREPKGTTSMRTWSCHANVVLHVNVFYHDTMHGLLMCEQNNAAASEIRNQLLAYSISRCKVTSRNALGRVPDSGSTSATPVRDGVKNRGSDFASGVFSIFGR